MKNWQISLIAIFAFLLVVVEALGASWFAARHVMTTARNLALEERGKQTELAYSRERLAAAILYKETAERLSDRGDYNGVLLAEAEYERQLQRIDERYPTATKDKFASRDLAR
jgi:type II secretory pathway component PulL